MSSHHLHVTKFPYHFEEEQQQKSECFVIDGDETSATVTMPAYAKAAGVKPNQSPMTFGGYGAAFVFTFLSYKLLVSVECKVCAVTTYISTKSGTALNDHGLLITSH